MIENADYKFHYSHFKQYYFCFSVCIYLPLAVQAESYPNTFAAFCH